MKIIEVLKKNEFIFFVLKNTQRIIKKSSKFYLYSQALMKGYLKLKDL